MKKFKRLLAVILVLIMVLSLGACGSTKTDTGAAADGTKEDTKEAETNLGKAVMSNAGEVDTERATTESTGKRYEKMTIALSQDPQDLNPWNPTNGSKGYVYPYIYEYLFDFRGDDAGYAPVLAKGYKEIDELHWQVELYDYIYDSAGNNITADDVIFDYQIAVDSGFAVKFDTYNKVEKVDDYTLLFTWNSPIDEVGELEWPLCHVCIFSKEAYESGNFATSPMATGPYKVESFTAGSGVVLQARDDYWQKDASLIGVGHHANVQTLEYDVISESSQVVLGLQNGTIDFAYSVPTEGLADFVEGGSYADSFGVYRAPSARQFNLMGNMSGNSIWSDINFRKACYYALDNEAISTVNNLAASKALLSPMWSNFYEEWQDQDNYMNVCDTEQAMKYLEESGYNGEKLKLVTINEETYKNTATMVQALLTNIGIDVEISALEETAANACLNDNTSFDLYIMMCGGGTAIGAWNRIFNNSDFEDGNCYGFNADPKLPELYAKANSAEGYNMENMTELEQYVIDNAYCYTISYGFNSLVYTKDIAQLAFALAEGSFRINDSIYYLD